MWAEEKIFLRHIMAAKALTVGHEDGERPSPVIRNEGKEPIEAREVQWTEVYATGEGQNLTQSVVSE